MNNDEHEKIGPACKTCSHPSGAHESFSEDLDEPEREASCRFEGCTCPGFID